MIESLLELDRELFVFLNGLGSTTWDGLWLLLTNKFASIPVYIILLILLYDRFGWKRIILILVVAALMIAFTDQISYFFKHWMQRPRPCQEESLEGIMRYIAPRCGRYGFFSGHASSAMAAAVLLSLLLQKWYGYITFLLLFWAFIIAYSRVYIGVHYPLDVIVGMAFGGIVGWSFYRLEQYLAKRFKVVLKD